MSRWNRELAVRATGPPSATPISLRPQTATSSQRRERDWESVAGEGDVQAAGAVVARPSETQRSYAMASKSTGVVDVTSSYSAAESIDRLEALVRQRGLIVFARIDVSGDAARAGLALRPMLALLFGNPRAGTPLRATQPRVGLDLPSGRWRGKARTAS